MAHDPRWIAVLLRLYPRAYRERHGGDLAAAMRACVERERQAGAPALLTAARSRRAHARIASASSSPYRSR